jgi:hypothetical protein
MSITPPRLSRRSSIWSVLKSLETLSSPPSWSSLASLPVTLKSGAYPLFFVTVAKTRLATYGLTLSRMFHFNILAPLAYSITAWSLEVRSIEDDNTGATSRSLDHRYTQTTPPKAPRTYSPVTMDSRECLPRSPSQLTRFQEARPLGLPQMVMMTPPHTSPVLSFASHLRSIHGDSSTTPHSVHSSSRPLPLLLNHWGAFADQGLSFARTRRLYAPSLKPAAPQRSYFF